MQVVRQFLTVGPITIDGKKYRNLTGFLFKSMFEDPMRGHHSNVQVEQVENSIRSPHLTCFRRMVDDRQAAVIAVVSKGLLEYWIRRQACEGHLTEEQRNAVRYSHCVYVCVCVVGRD